MKLTMAKVFIMFSLIFLFTSCSQRDEILVLEGPYLGQKPPGMTAEIFAPGIISTGNSERCAAFTPDGKELYYIIWGPPYGVILSLKEEKNGWTKPRVAPFSGRYGGDFTMSPDGNSIVFSSAD